MRGKKTLRLILPIVAALWCAAAAPAQDTVRIPLMEAIERGVEKSVDAVAARNDYISSYWQYRTYLTEMLPTLELTSVIPQLSRSLNQNQNEDGSYTYVHSNYNFLSSSLSLTQNIPFTGGKVSVETGLERLRQRGASASTQYRSIPYAVTLEQQLGGFNSLRWLRKIEPLRFEEAQKELAGSCEEVALMVIQYYFNLLIGQINLEIARQNCENAEKLYTISEARHHIGQMSDVDLMQMHSSLLAARSQLIAAGSSLEGRMLQLRSYLGFGQQTVVVPELPGDPARLLPLLEYGQVLEKALENHPFTASVRRRILEATREVNRARAERWDATLFASFGMTAQEATLRQSYNRGKWRDDRNISVGVRIPILDWGKGKGKVRMAQASREAELARIEKDRMDFNQEVYMQVRYFNDQPSQLALARQMDEIAQKRYQTSVETFILDKIDILTLNDSQSVKDEARRNYIEQLYMLWHYHYRIRALTLYDFAENRPLVYETIVKK